MRNFDDPRRPLERQPTGVIRVCLDGVLLACNDAALNLLGVDAPLAGLNTNLTDRIAPDQRTRWQEFTTRCWAKGAASLECHFVLPGKRARPVLVEGIALKDHPDGLESLLLSLRDEPQTPALEHSTQSVEIDRVGAAELQAIAERVKLAAQADDDRAERRRLTEALEAQTADRQRREARLIELEKRVEQSRLLLLQREREYGRDTAMLKSVLAAAHATKTAIVAGHAQELEAVTLRLQAATAEQARLEALVAEYEIDRKRIAADHQAAVDALEQSLARAREEAALGLEQSRQASAELRSELQQAQAGQSRMASHAAEQKREHDLMLAQHQRALVDLEAGRDAALAELRSQLAGTSAERESLSARVALAERELELLRTEHSRALTDLEAGNGIAAELRRQLSESFAEQGRLATGLEEHALAHDRLIAEHHRALADMETGGEALEELRLQQSQALAEQRRLAERLEEQERERDGLIAEHHRALAEMESGKRDALAELRTQLSQAFADQRRLASRADEQELELDRLRAEHHAALTDAETRNRDALAELRTELEQAAAEPGRILAERIEEHERERDRMSAEHNLAIGELQASREAALAELRSQLSEAVAERQCLTALLEEHDRERERLAAEQRALTVVAAVDGIEPVNPLHEPFDALDDAFVNRMLEGIRATPRPESLADPAVGPAKAATEVQAVTTIQTVTTSDQPANDVFDDLDATFVESLMNRPGPPRESDDQADADPLPEP